MNEDTLLGDGTEADTDDAERFPVLHSRALMHTGGGARAVEFISCRRHPLQEMGSVLCTVPQKLANGARPLQARTSTF